MSPLGLKKFWQWGDVTGSGYLFSHFHIGINENKIAADLQTLFEIHEQGKFDSLILIKKSYCARKGMKIHFKSYVAGQQSHLIVDWLRMALLVKEKGIGFFIDKETEGTSSCVAVIGDV